MGHDATSDAVDPSSDASIGSFVTAKAKDLWQASDTHDTVHREPERVEVAGKRSRCFLEGHREWEFERSGRGRRTYEYARVRE